MQCPQDLKDIAEEWTERMEEPKERSMHGETLSSKHNTAIGLMNSQQRWLPAQELIKTGSANIPSKAGEGAPKALSLAEELLASDGLLREKSFFIH